MGITALSGPLVSFGVTQGSTGRVGEYNEERGPSLFDCGHATLDPRYQLNYKPGAPVGTAIMGWYGGEAFVDTTPYHGSTIALVTKTSMPAAGGTVALTGSSTAGGFLTTFVPATGGAAVTVVAIDSTGQTLNFGTGDTVRVWDPTAGSGRCIWVAPNSTTDTGAVVIAGYDMYGFPMTETIPLPGSSAGVTSTSVFATGLGGNTGGGGQKAFKYVSAITIASTSVLASTSIFVGVLDAFGMPLKVAYTGMPTSVRLSATSSLGQPTVNSTGTVVIGSTAATQTSTTPDVRGVYLSSTAMNGAIRLQIMQRITPNMAYTMDTSQSSDWLGTQYSSF